MRTIRRKKRIILYLYCTIDNDRNSKPEDSNAENLYRSRTFSVSMTVCVERFDRLPAAVQHGRHTQTRDRWMIAFYRIQQRYYYVRTYCLCSGTIYVENYHFCFAF